MAGVIIVPNAITVGHGELPGSPTESFPADIRTRDATRLLECAWADRLQLAKELRGYTSQSGEGDVLVHSRHPYPSDSALLCNSVGVAPLLDALANTSPSTVATYEKAQLTVRYTIPEKDEKDPAQVLVTESLEPSVMLLTRPKRGLYWHATIHTVNTEMTEIEVPVLPVKNLVWVFTAHKLTSVPSQVGSLINHVNSDTVTSVTFGLSFTAGTLIFGPPQLSADYLDDGTRAFKATYRFEYNPDGWNKFPRPAKFGGGLAPLYDTPSHEWSPFESGAFLPVLRRTFS